MRNVIHSYRGLIVWQKAMDLVTMIYNITQTFPKEEQFGLISQMRRAAVSIPSNIAEGRLRGSRRDFLKYLRIAYGSSAELETLLTMAKRLPACKESDFVKAEGVLLEVMKMLNAMLKKMKPQHPEKANEAKKLTKLSSSTAS